MALRRPVSPVRRGWFQWDSGWQQAAFLINTTRMQTRAHGPPRITRVTPRSTAWTWSAVLKVTRSKKPGYVPHQKEFFLSSVCAGHSQEGQCRGGTGEGREPW